MNATFLLASCLLIAQSPSADPPPAADPFDIPPLAAPPAPIDEAPPKTAPADTKPPATEPEPAIPPAEIDHRFEPPPIEPPSIDPTPIDSVPIDRSPGEPSPKKLMVPVRRAPAAKSQGAAGLLKKFLAAPPKNALAGEPISLLQAFTLSRDRRGRIAVARAYWNLSAATVRYHLTTGDFARLQATATASGGLADDDAALISAALASAKARRHEAHLMAVTAQQELADLLRGPAEELPLTVAMPLVGRYRTRFTEIFASHPAPPAARLIDRTLPIRYETIVARAESAMAAFELFESRRQSHAQGSVALSVVLARDVELRRQHRAFLDAVFEYNRTIADYAGVVAGSSTSDTTLVAMLIPVKARVADTSTLSRSPLRIGEPTLAPPPPEGATKIE